MSDLRRRVDRLAARAAPPVLIPRRVIVHTDEEAAAARASVKPGEFLFMRRIVEPGGRP